jgi:hypothetical protein
VQKRIKCDGLRSNLQYISEYLDYTHKFQYETKFHDIEWVKQEYGLIQEKKSKLSRSEKDEVKRIYKLIKVHNAGKA